jgi:hypothetical protein
VAVRFSPDVMVLGVGDHFGVAPCGGLRSTPDCRPRRAFLHLSYSYAASLKRGNARSALVKSTAKNVAPSVTQQATTHAISVQKVGTPAAKTRMPPECSHVSFGQLRTNRPRYRIRQSHGRQWRARPCRQRQRQFGGELCDSRRLMCSPQVASASCDRRCQGLDCRQSPVLSRFLSEA